MLIFYEDYDHAMDIMSHYYSAMAQTACFLPFHFYFYFLRNEKMNYYFAKEATLVYYYVYFGRTWNKNLFQLLFVVFRLLFEV